MTTINFIKTVIYRGKSYTPDVYLKYNDVLIINI